MATVVNGTNLLVYVGGTAIAGSKTCKLTLSHDGRDTSTKDDSGYKTGAEGMRSWSVSCDGMVAFDASNYAPDDMSNLIINRTKVYLKFGGVTSGQYYWQGYAYLKSFDIDAGTEDSVTYSASFDGTGTVSQAMVT